MIVVLNYHNNQEQNFTDSRRLLCKTCNFHSFCVNKELFVKKKDEKRAKQIYHCF